MLHVLVLTRPVIQFRGGDDPRIKHPLSVSQFSVTSSLHWCLTKSFWSLFQPYGLLSPTPLHTPKSQMKEEDFCGKVFSSGHSACSICPKLPSEGKRTNAWVWVLPRRRWFHMSQEDGKLSVPWKASLSEITFCGHFQSALCPSQWLDFSRLPSKVLIPALFPGHSSVIPLILEQIWKCSATAFPPPPREDCLLSKEEFSIGKRLSVKAALYQVSIRLSILISSSSLDSQTRRVFPNAFLLRPCCNWRCQRLNPEHLYAKHVPPCGGQGTFGLWFLGAGIPPSGGRRPGASHVRTKTTFFPTRDCR